MRINKSNSFSIRWMGVVMALSVLLSAVITPAGSLAEASQTMKSTNGITWDLVPKKTVTYYTYVGGAYVKQKARINSAVTKKLNKKTAQLTLKIKYDGTCGISSSKIHKICDYYEAHPGKSFNQWCYVAVTDNNTGKSLAAKNKKGVVVNTSKFKTVKTKKYTSGGDSVTLADRTVTVKIKYPISYKGMCIGIGGYSKYKAGKASKKFWTGKGSFWKAKNLYSKKKKVAHFVQYRF